MEDWLICVVPLYAESHLTQPAHGSDTNFLLFEVYPTPIDVKADWIFIPVEQALDHFLPLAYCRKIYMETIKITDPENLDRFVTVTYDILHNVASW